MIETERENPTEPILRNAKALRLVDQRRVLNSEGLIFVSPRQDGSQKCGKCGQIYSPLIYQLDGEIESQHFHGTEGGIYYYNNYDVGAIIPQDWTGWIAILEPTGKSDSRAMITVSRSEKVRVKEIRAYCSEVHCKRRLDEGVVITIANDPGSLIPLCGVDVHPECAQDAKYTFKITEDGEVLFSQI